MGVKGLNDRPELFSPTHIEIETLEGIDDCRSKWGTYEYMGNPVPRMSEILKECIGKDYLISYALNCKNYYAETEQILYTGTIVHQMIDEFLKYGAVKSDINFVNEDIFNKAHKAYNNFVTWYNDMLLNNYTITPIAIEKQVITPWYGGCIDCIMEIKDKNNNSKIYIVDFKTSTKIAIDYLIQTYGYFWAVQWYSRNISPTEFPNIDGIGIIRVDKKSRSNESIFIDLKDLSSPYPLNLHNAFVSCLDWFYYQKHLNWMIKDIKRNG